MSSWYCLLYFRFLKDFMLTCASALVCLCLRTWKFIVAGLGISSLVSVFCCIVSVFSFVCLCFRKWSMFFCFTIWSFEITVIKSGFIFLKDFLLTRASTLVCLCIRTWTLLLLVLSEYLKFDFFPLLLCCVSVSSVLEVEDKRPGMVLLQRARQEVRERR